MCNLPKNDPNDLILDRNKIQIKQTFSKGCAQTWSHYDVTLTLYHNFTLFGDFGHNSLTLANYQLNIDL